jgi:hypothetical protein
MQTLLKPILLFALIALLLGACEETGGTEDNANFSQLNDGNYILEVDRMARHPDVQFPHEPLVENDYEETYQGNQYEVRFSANGDIVTIEGEQISGEIEIVTGSIEIEEEDSTQYELHETGYGGGRFSVWIADGHLAAEYTIYGSGVPVIQSERGRLVPVD